MGTEFDELVAEIEREALDAAAGLLRSHGVCPRPTVFMFSGVRSPTFMGTVTARRMSRGQDAADALRGLGLLPSVLQGPRLLVAWENAEMQMLLDEPGEAFPAGLVIVDGTLDGHTVRWHPFIPRYGPRTVAGYPTVTVAWLPAMETVGGALPGPVVELLALWREQRGGNLDVTRAALKRSGFGVFWLADLAQAPHDETGTAVAG